MIHIRPATVTEITSDKDFLALAKEYAEESRMEGWPTPEPDIETYKNNEASGMIAPIGVYSDDTLIGFALLMYFSNPHYGKMIGVTETLFVAKAYRKTGAGLRLISSIENIAKYIGCFALLISANAGSTLEKILLRKKYKHTNSIMMRVL